MRHNKSSSIDGENDGAKHEEKRAKKSFIHAMRGHVLFQLTLRKQSFIFFSERTNQKRTGAHTSVVWSNMGASVS
jgi:hypothetical protein